MHARRNLISAGLAAIFCLLLVLLTTHAALGETALRVFRARQAGPGVYRSGGHIDVKGGSFKEFAVRFGRNSSQDIIIQYRFTNIKVNPHKRWASSVALVFATIPKLIAYNHYPRMQFLYGPDFDHGERISYTSGNQATITVKIVRAKKLVIVALNQAYTRRFNYRGRLSTSNIAVRIIGTDCRLDCEAFTPAAGVRFTNLWNRY